MADDLARQLLGSQRRRLVARLLGSVEREFDVTSAPPELRTEVMDAVGVYHDFVLDLVGARDDGVLRNEHAMRMLAEIHAEVARAD